MALLIVEEHVRTKHGQDVRRIIETGLKSIARLKGNKYGHLHQWPAENKHSYGS